MKSLAVLAFLTASALHAQLKPILLPDLPPDPLVLRQHVEAGKPFTVAGEQGVLVGDQQGSLEAWLLPIKLLSHLTLTASVAGYPIPLDVNTLAREIEVYPDRTVITYTHIAFTIRQIMFAPAGTPPGTGAAILFQIDSSRAIDLTLAFTPEMRFMWPQPGGGNPSADWIATPGFYILHTDTPDFAAAIALPGAQPGTMAPYQERPQTHPLELRLHADPTPDPHLAYPLLMAIGRTPETTSTSALQATLSALNQQLPALYTQNQQQRAQQSASLTSIHTPDPALDDDFAWAESSISTLRTKASSGEVALVAGYFQSGDSTRPGFGWFFGRDALYTLYGIDSYGDFPLARQELEFLIKRQRADGKMMHEYSQTAPAVDWASLPYQYAAADATPLFLTALCDYVLHSGDTAFLQSNREAILKAWRFETTHDADRDGIYDNAQGTGWVENWRPTGLPHQEIYLALLDAQASDATARLADILGDPQLAAAARTRAAKVRATIERLYYLPKTGLYAFSSEGPGTLDTADTLFPAIAWWNPGPALAHPEPSLEHWASATFDTDWGTRDIAETDPIYDPISYHLGSVWPLFTGWAALAEYRGGHPLAAYQATMQNAGLTATQDLGAVTELLSGEFFTPFGRSTSHQLWSSAMVVTPIIRGLFGISVNALDHTITLSPHLPADWDHAEIHRLHIGSDVVDLTFRRESGEMIVSLSDSKNLIRLDDGRGTKSTELHLPLPAVEVSVPHGLPLPGARTQQIKVIRETYHARSLDLLLEAPAETTAILSLHQNQPVKIQAEGAELRDNRLNVHFPPGNAYTQQTVLLRW